MRAASCPLVRVRLQHPRRRWCRRTRAHRRWSESRRCLRLRCPRFPQKSRCRCLRCPLSCRTRSFRTSDPSRTLGTRLCLARRHTRSAPRGRSRTQGGARHLRRCVHHRPKARPRSSPLSRAQSSRGYSRNVGNSRQGARTFTPCDRRLDAKRSTPRRAVSCVKQSGARSERMKWGIFIEVETGRVDRVRHDQSIRLSRLDHRVETIASSISAKRFGRTGHT